MDMSLIHEFVQEAREYIDEIEPTLIEINNGATAAGQVDAEMINAIFRLFHSMKGSAGFLDFTTVVAVTHEAETLLDRIRNGKASLTVQITGTLCKALDLFREMLVRIETAGQDDGFEQPAEAIINVLKKFVAGEPVDNSEIGMTTPPPPPKADAPANAEASEEIMDDFSFGELADEPAKQPVSVDDLDFTEPTGEANVETPADSVESASPSDTELATLQLAPEMRRGFALEAVEQLDSAEAALLLILDESVEKIEPLKDAFRYIHSFKGNCGFMGLVQMEHLSHVMETLLDALRSNEVTPCERNISTLLGMIDVLQEAVEDLEGGGIGRINDLDTHVQTLETLLSQKNGVHAAPEPMPVAAPPEPESSPPEPAPAAAAPATTEGESEEDWDAKIAAAFAARDAKMKEEEAAAPVAAAPPAPAPAPPSEPAPTPPAPAAPPPAPPSGGALPPKPPAAKQDIRVDLHKLDLLINLVGELVIAESMVTRCPAVANVEDEYYNRAKHQLRRICDELQDCAMSVRMIPLAATFRKMVRLVHDLATKSGKKIKLNLVGEDTEVDKTVIEQIADPLVHIVRNSCDHGVEPPEERLKNGKTDTGSVTLEGKHEGGEVWILITDDGRGLNREKILKKAIDVGLVGIDAREWPDERIFKLVFEPGFSTADKVTDISGRGVGMDVVKRNIEKLNGRIDISSKLGKGSTFTLRIPLTLAIVDAMLVRVGEGKYMIPTLTIRESLVPTMEQVTVTPEGREILRLREEMVPIIRLYDVFGCRPGAEKLKDGILIVAEDSGKSFAFFVDEIVGQQQTVIKGLPDYIGESNGFSGCTILGDGTVSLIVDVGAVSEMSGSFHASPVNKKADWQDEDEESVAASSGDMSFDDFESVAGMS
ncbi:MAG: chemotaxis protein CheA [Planctomycetaceae bacterium]|nr:chemotaxis protein CheA [Planctomycetaceae bacterium]